MPGVRTWAATHNGSMHFSYTHPYASTRLPVFARNVVSTSHPLAAQAGLRMLQQGGNAVDAAVAAAAAMTICEPVSNGLGSDAFCILWDGQALHGLNASGRAPAAWTPGYFHSRYGKSPLLAASVTLISVVGIVPYIALQLKAIASGYSVLTSPLGEVAPPNPQWWRDSTLYVALALAGFTSFASAQEVYIPLVSKGFQHQFWQAVRAGAARVHRAAAAISTSAARACASASNSVPAKPGGRCSRPACGRSKRAWLDWPLFGP